MKQWKMLPVVLALTGLLGCSAGTGTVMETLSDPAGPESGAPKYCLSVPVPGDTELSEVFCPDGMEVYSQPEGELELTVETRQADSLDQLLRELTGKERTELTVLSSRSGDLVRYDLSWTAFGDEGSLACRAAILDDGQHYYVVTASLPPEQAALRRDQLGECFRRIQAIPSIQAGEKSPVAP